jgi:hypothetical protein
MNNTSNFESLSRELLSKLIQKNIINSSLSRSDISKALLVINLFFETKVKEEAILDDLKDKD